MKKIGLTFIIFLTTATLCRAQKIESKKVFGGYKFSAHGTDLSMSELVEIMESNKQAYPIMKKAKANHTVVSVMGFAGGFLIGWPIGAALANKDPDWTLAGIGAGLVAIAIPISATVGRQTKQAIDIYNAGLKPSSLNEFKPEFKLLVKGNGIGLSMQF